MEYSPYDHTLLWSRGGGNNNIARTYTVLVRARPPLLWYNQNLKIWKMIENCVVLFWSHTRCWFNFETPRDKRVRSCNETKFMNETKVNEGELCSTEKRTSIGKAQIHAEEINKATTRADIHRNKHAYTATLYRHNISRKGQRLRIDHEIHYKIWTCATKTYSK